jgi:large subunit ribosomal protein L5e
MAFVKVIKNKAYSSRMQTKPRRRRQGKTDYFARRRLVCQEKNKYASRKYRLVVRRTCTKYITQIIFSTMTGDRVMCQASSEELKAHGLKAGLTNWSAGYCTGLLIARRLLAQVKLDGLYKPNEEVNGEYFNVEDDADDDKRPFKAALDVGIHRTTTGARIFAVVKGAADGGLNVPHNTKRFPGYTRAKVEEVVNKRGKATGEVERMEAKFEAKVLRDRIFGGHVTAYMNQLKKEDAGKFKRQFSRWEKALAEAKVKTCEELYKKVHKSIIAKPAFVKAKGNAKPNRTRQTTSSDPARLFTNKCAKPKANCWLRERKLTNQEKKDAVNRKMMLAMQRLAGN